MREDSLRGVTSNPAIFEKAILGSTDYDEQVAELAGEGLDARQIYEEIAITDVRLACDVLRGVWDEAGGADGFVSLEVEPAFAHETDATLAQARDFWARVDRPNLMIKIPGTEEGVPGDRAGDRRRHQRQRDAAVQRRVLQRRSPRPTSAAWSAALEAGEPLDVHSVASFFVSRVDTEVDKRLAELGREDLRGVAAIANARAAYMSFKELFLGERFAAPARRRLSGAAPAVGVDRGQGPALPGDQVRRLAGRPAHRQHDADAHAAGLRGAAAR